MPGGHERVDDRGDPNRALAVTWALVTLLLLAGSRAQLFALSSIAVLTQYIVTSAALLVLSLRETRGLRRAHAAIAVPAGIVSLALVAGARGGEAAVAGALMAAGLLLRALARRSARPLTA